MGLDLKLLPLLRPGDGMSRNILCINRRDEIFEEIRKLPSWPQPQPFYCHEATIPDGTLAGNSCSGIVTEDAYGDPLEYVVAKDIAALRGCSDIKDCPINRPIWAYLSAMDGDWPIVLYWW